MFLVTAIARINRLKTGEVVSGSKLMCSSALATGPILRRKDTRKVKRAWSYG